MTAYSSKGCPPVTRRTVPKKLHGACRRIKQWIRLNRHLPGRQFIAGLNRRLCGHYNYYALIGNSRALRRFYQWAIECPFKWLNRCGGKRSSFNWAVFNRAVTLLNVAKPRITTERSACGTCLKLTLAQKRVQSRNRMRENRMSGSMRGAPGNRRSSTARG